MSEEAKELAKKLRKLLGEEDMRRSRSKEPPTEEFTKYSLWFSKYVQ